MHIILDSLYHKWQVKRIQQTWSKKKMQDHNHVINWFRCTWIQIKPHQIIERTKTYLSIGQNTTRGKFMKIKTLIKMVSPRNSWSFSMVSGWRDTTELSSLTASSTTSRFGAFFLSKMAVLKSLFVPLLHRNQNSEKKQSRTETSIRVRYLSKIASLTQSIDTARDLIMR